MDEFSSEFLQEVASESECFWDTVCIHVYSCSYIAVRFASAGAVCRRCVLVHASAGVPQSSSSVPLPRATTTSRHDVSAVVLRHRPGNRLRDAACPSPGNTITRPV